MTAIDTANITSSLTADLRRSAVAIRPLVNQPSDTNANSLQNALNEPATNVDISDAAKVAIEKAESDQEVAIYLERALRKSNEVTSVSLTFQDVVGKSNDSKPIANGTDVLTTTNGLNKKTITRQELIDDWYSRTDIDFVTFGEDRIASFREAYENGTLSFQTPEEIPGFEEEITFEHRELTGVGGGSGTLTKSGVTEKGLALIEREYDVVGWHKDYGHYIVSWGEERNPSDAD